MKLLWFLNISMSSFSRCLRIQWIKFLSEFFRSTFFFIYIYSAALVAYSHVSFCVCVSLFISKFQILLDKVWKLYFFFFSVLCLRCADVYLTLIFLAFVCHFIIWYYAISTTIPSWPVCNLSQQDIIYCVARIIFPLLDLSYIVQVG